MNINEVYSGNYLKAEHIPQGKAVRVTIATVSVEEFDSNDKVERKIVLGFQGKDKKFVVNKTNAAIIAENIGSTNSDDWIGQSIQLVNRKVEYAGKLVPAIRVLIEEKASPAPAPVQAPQPAISMQSQTATESDDVPF